MDDIAPRATLDRQMADLRERVIHIGELALAQLDQVLAVIASGDVDDARQIAANDRAVDSDECAIEQLALKITALQQPEARDLRALVSAVAIAGSLERIGDHAKTIAKRLPAAAVMATLPGCGLAEIGAAAAEAVRRVMQAFAAQDAELAMAVRDHDAELDQLYDTYVETVVAAMERNSAAVRAGVFLIYAARNFERIGDHATNIAERIHFETRGTLPRDERRRPWSIA